MSSAPAPHEPPVAKKRGRGRPRIHPRPDDGSTALSTPVPGATPGTAPPPTDPRLREEIEYTEFYPDLRADELLPVAVATVPKQTPTMPTLQAMPLHHPDAALLKQPQFSPAPQQHGSQPAVYHERLRPLLTAVRKRLSGYGFIDPKRHSRPKDEVYLRAEDLLDPVAHRVGDWSQFRVEYDMDEQDFEFMEELNRLRALRLPADVGLHRRGTPVPGNGNSNGNGNVNGNVTAPPAEPLPVLMPEVFEAMITVLENAWSLLERQLPPAAVASGGYALPVNVELYGSDDGTGFVLEEEQSCAVCGGFEGDNANAIVFCDGCNIAVHQECYGVAFIPEGQWLCRKCMLYNSLGTARVIRCAFCPSTTGAFKQTDTGVWGHVVCAVWIPELYFANPVYVEPIEGMEVVPRGRWRLQCYICKQKHGACIQCSSRNCFALYHVTCARRALFYMQMARGFTGACSDQLLLTSYCDRHSPREWLASGYDPKEGISRTRRYFAATAGGRRHAGSAVALGGRRHANKPEQAPEDPYRWKTPGGAPMAPQGFADQLALFLVLELEFPREDAQLLAEQACRYWTLKREYRNGAPLVRRSDYYPRQQYGWIREEEVELRLALTREVLPDLDRLEAVMLVVVRRQQVLEERLGEQHRVLDTVYFPLKHVLRSLMERLQEIDTTGVLVQCELEGAPLDAPVHLWREFQARFDANEFGLVDQFVEEYRYLLHRLTKQQSTPYQATRVFKRFALELGSRFAAARKLELELAVAAARAAGEGDGAAATHTLLRDLVLAVPGVVVDGARVAFRLWLAQGGERSDASDLSDLDTEG